MEQRASGSTADQREPAERTRHAYATDWRLFERWCRERSECAWPASTPTLARYLTHLAHSGRKASTIRRARVAIGTRHARQGLPRPDRDACVRSLGTQAEAAAPLRVPELERMVVALGHCVRDDRDRALLLLGFAGALRSSDLVGLDVSDLELQADGLRVRLRGAWTFVPRARNPRLCAVAALERWVQRLDGTGPLFRLVYGARVSQDRLSARAVSRAVQRAAARAGVVGEYSSHSLRAGLATSAHALGRSSRDIQLQGRWKDPRSLERYLQSFEPIERIIRDRIDTLLSATAHLTEHVTQEK